MCVRSQEQHRSGSPRQRGFTLVEVMTVSAIIGIMSMIAMPAYLKWSSRYQLRQTTTEVAGSFQLARMAARSRNSTVTATFVKAADGSVNLDFGGVLRAITLPTGIVDGSLVVTNPGPAVITTQFKPAGVGTLGTIQFSQLGLRVGGGIANQLVTLVSTQGLTFSIVVTPSGKVNWCANASCP